MENYEVGNTVMALLSRAPRPSWCADMGGQQRLLLVGQGLACGHAFECKVLGFDDYASLTYGHNSAEERYEQGGVEHSVHVLDGYGMSLWMIEPRQLMETVAHHTGISGYSVRCTLVSCYHPMLLTERHHLVSLRMGENEYTMLLR